MCVLAESDNESVPTSSPSKFLNRSIRVKTLEEIKLERIQAESAAYYSYPSIDSSLEPTVETQEANDLRKRILKRLNKQPQPNTDFKILTLDEIRKRKLNSNSTDGSSDEEKTTKLRKTQPESIKSIKLSGIVKINTNSNTEIKIKTLAEIRAARREREAKENACPVITELPIDSSENRLPDFRLPDPDRQIKRGHSPTNEEVSSKRLHFENDVISSESDMHVSSSLDDVKARRRLVKASPRKPKLNRGKTDDELSSTQVNGNNENRLSPDPNKRNGELDDRLEVPDIVADCNKVDNSTEILAAKLENDARTTSLHETSNDVTSQNATSQISTSEENVLSNVITSHDSMSSGIASQDIESVISQNVTSDAITSNEVASKVETTRNELGTSMDSSDGEDQVMRNEDSLLMDDNEMEDSAAYVTADEDILQNIDDLLNE